ncbi:capsular polysaccharide synthesis protein [Liquorilactobacillus satsumensis]|uniref:capsular polysaccharide synthesis protein n=1 Tax=Liquorilactobacillus satsumensis TaxID=259059 RepID=UPI000704B14A|nr:capsular polysaccharide synthesis protein [Liquorilactobacillus satsumensis]MCP9328145.1 hypothetical protein [Liquorilactobacillus satsumensis]
MSRKFITFKWEYRISYLMMRLHCPVQLCRLYNEHRHRRVLKYISAYLNDSLKELETNDEEEIQNSSEKCIWVFWWQGYKAMPDVVKACINSIKKHANQHKVIIISRSNFKEYIKLDPRIYHKILEGYFSLAHVSDIFRFNLLRHYGGLWMDATLFVNRDLSDQYFNDNFYTSGKYEEKYEFNISDGKWTEFLIGGNKQSKLFSFIDIFFKNYCSVEDNFIDYFLADYVLFYAYKMNIGEFRTYIDENVVNRNQEIFSLLHLFMQDKPFDKNEFSKITNKNDIFKLSYKKKFLGNMKNGGYYKKMIN